MALLLYCACTMWQLMSFAATLLNQNQTLWKNQDGFLVATVKSALTRFSLNHHHHRIAVVTLKNHQKFILSFVNNFRFPSFHMLSIGAIIVCYDCDVRCMILKTSDINFQPFLSHTSHFTLHIRLLYSQNAIVNSDRTFQLVENLFWGRLSSPCDEIYSNLRFGK